MYAIIETGGQQLKVAPGDTIRVQRIDSAEKEVSISKVLVIAKKENILIGKPYVENAAVKAEIQGEKKGTKVLVYKQKPRKGFRKLRGHRQDYTVLKITDIVVGG